MERVEAGPMSNAIPVYVGCSANHEDAEAQAVLEHTLRRHASRPVEITWMRLSRDPASPFSRTRWDISTWATPFSGFRWGVPSFTCGRAIYVDVDFVFLADVAELFDADMSGARYLSDVCTGIMLFAARDCDAGDEARGPLPGLWNCRDEWPEGAKAIHFTSLFSQPHMQRAGARLAARGRKHWNTRPQRAHPVPALVDLFERELAAAEAAGFKVASYEDEVRCPSYGAYGTRRLAC